MFLIGVRGDPGPPSGNSWLTCVRPNAHTRRDAGRLWVKKQGTPGLGRQGKAGRRTHGQVKTDSLEKEGKEYVRRCLE